jgi:hypothetical protein
MHRWIFGASAARTSSLQGEFKRAVFERAVLERRQHDPMPSAARSPARSWRRIGVLVAGLLAVSACAVRRPRPSTASQSPKRSTSAPASAAPPAAASEPRSEALEARLSLSEQLSDFRNTFFQRDQPAPIRPRLLRRFSSSKIVGGRAYAFRMAPLLGGVPNQLPLERDGKLCDNVVAPGIELPAEQLQRVVEFVETSRTQHQQALQDALRSSGHYAHRPLTRCDFEPHHTIVFHDQEGAALGGILVCFTCREWRIIPSVPELDGYMSDAELALMRELFDGQKLGASLFDDQAAAELEEYRRRVYGTVRDGLTPAGVARYSRWLAGGSGAPPQKDARSMTRAERTRSCLWFQQELYLSRSYAHPGSGFECDDGRRFQLREQDLKQCAASQITCAVSTAQVEACLAEVILDTAGLCNTLPMACREVIACLPQLDWRPRAAPGELATTGAVGMTRPTCSNPDPQLSHLESLLNLEPSDIYWVNVRADGTDWTLAEPVTIPRHHALRFEFENQAEFPAFPEAPQQALRVTFQITKQDRKRVSGGHTWRNTVRARLIDVCPSPTRPTVGR